MKHTFSAIFLFLSIKKAQLHRWLRLNYLSFFDLDLFGFFLFGFAEGDLNDAVFETGARFFFVVDMPRYIQVVGERCLTFFVEGALFLLLLPFPFDPEGAIFESDLDVVLLKSRKGGFDVDVVLIFGDGEARVLLRAEEGGDEVVFKEGREKRVRAQLLPFLGDDILLFHTNFPLKF